MLQVDADGAVETEQVRADGFTGGVGDTHAAHAQVVAQGAVDHQVAQCVENGVFETQRFAIGPGGTHALRH